MGSCVSVHKSPAPASTTSHHWPLGSDNNRNPLILSPVQKPDTLNGGDRTTLAELALEPRSPSSRSRHVDARSQEETFFDSQTWLESDCEDDFLSINGDFTPSGGSTPIHHHHNSSSRKSPVSKAPLVEGKILVPEQSPSDKNKRLSELFKESSRNHLDIDDECAALSKENVVSEVEQAAAEATTSSPVLLHKFKNRDHCTSGGSGDRTLPPPPPPLTDYGAVRADDKSGKPAQCCLPKMISNRSFSERKKKASPGSNRIG